MSELIERLASFDQEWRAGPDLPTAALLDIPALLEADLIERKFFDEAAPSVSYLDGAVTFRVRACWHFRLTQTGLSTLTAALRSAAASDHATI